MSRSRWTGHFLKRRLAVYGVALVVLAVAAGSCYVLRVAGTASAHPAINPALFIHPHTTAVHGTLAGEASITGWLFPTIPGVNTLHLVILRPSGTRQTRGRVAVVADMAGMKMTPSRALLTPGSHGRTGRILLPMFGLYRMRVVVTTPAGVARGVIELNVPMPGQ